MVRPTLEYASTYWDPHSKDLIEDIEQVQKKEQHVLFTIITGVKNQGAL
jgi:mevalonate pyrophosphate decarboxylase